MRSSTSRNDWIQWQRWFSSVQFSLKIWSLRFVHAGTKLTWLCHFYSAVHTHLFDIPVIQLSAWRSWISTLRAHRRGAQKAILCRPQTHQQGRKKKRGLRRIADWLIVYSKLVWLQPPGRPDLPDLTLWRIVRVLYSYWYASCFSPSMQSALLPLHSLSWMESDNPPHCRFL